MDKIKALWESLPKAIKVFCFIAFSYTLKFAAVQLGLIEDSPLAEYLTGIINIALVIIESAVPAVRKFFNEALEPTK